MFFIKLRYMGILTQGCPPEAACRPSTAKKRGCVKTQQYGILFCFALVVGAQFTIALGL